MTALNVPHAIRGSGLALLLGGLSPRRRILVIGLALVVAAGAVTAVVAVAASGGSGLTVAGYPPQDRQGPVLLVPGYGGRPVTVVLAARIRARGRQATVVSCPVTARAA